MPPKRAVAKKAGSSKKKVYETLKRTPTKKVVVSKKKKNGRDEPEELHQRVRSGYIWKQEKARNPNTARVGVKSERARFALRLQRAKKKREALKRVGMYKRRLTWVEITLHATVLVYDGKKKVDKTVDEYKTDQKDYVGIRWNENKQSTWLEKLHQAQDTLYNQFITIIESNSEVKSHYFTYKETTKRDLNKVVHDPKNVPMLGVSEDPIEYHFIPANVNKQKPGYCVDAYLIEKYQNKDNIPTLSQEKLDAIMGKLDPKMGRTPEQVDKFCAEYNISHYALDFKHKVFLKEVRADRSYPALMYYSISNHLYPVTDRSTRTKISRKSAVQKCTVGTNLQASQNEKKQVEEENKMAKLFDLPTHEEGGYDRLAYLTGYRDSVLDPSKIMKMKDCNIFYHTHSLRDLALELYKYKKGVYEMKHLGHNMIQIIIPTNNVRLFANVNHRTSNPLKKTDGRNVAYGWNDVRVECEAFKIPFTNQSFTQLAKQVQSRSDTKGKKRCLRVQITPKIRFQKMQDQHFQCKTCHIKICAENSETDHITPLEQGGDNEYDNLQQLCKKCHDQKTRKEAASRSFDTDNTQSDYNEETLKIFKVAKNGFINNFDPEKHWQYRVKKGITGLFGLDICKTRTEIIYRNKDPWLVFSIFDQVCAFDKEKHMNKGKLIPCVVRVETNNYIPFKGTGWYSYSMVNKALAKGLIKLDQIKHCVTASFTLPADYYVPFVETVREKLRNKNLAKLMVNMFVGSLGHKLSKHRSVFLTDSLNEASYHKFCCVEDEKNRVHVHESTEVKGMYEIVKTREQYCESSHVPIFNQVLDEEAWQIYEIKELLLKHNCEPELVYCNTDNIVAEFRNPRDIEACRREGMNIFWDAERQFPKYKEQTEIHNVDRQERDVNGDPLVPKLQAGKVIRPYYLKDLSYKQLYKDTGKMDFDKLAEMVIAMMRRGEHGQTQGRAGTGKTTLVKKCLSILRSENDFNRAVLQEKLYALERSKEYRGMTDRHKDEAISAETRKHYADHPLNHFMVMCPTHKSCKALDADAVTLHSQWAIMKNAGSDLFTRNAFIFIDEKSLVHEGFWKAILQCVHRMEEKGTKCAIWISGDWDQLPPVCDRSTSFNYEHSQAIWEISGGNMVTLSHCRRTDKSGQELFNMCKNVSKIDLTQFKTKEYDLALAYTNSVRRNVNEKWMEITRKGEKYITIPAVPTKPKETQEISVYAGLPLIGIDTWEKYGIVNAEQYIVIAFDQRTIEVGIVLDDDEIDADTIVSIPVAEFGRLLQPAYCISVHRSQCGTFRRPYTIYQTKKMREMDEAGGDDLGKRLLYVALSRASDPKFINISNEYD